MEVKGKENILRITALWAFSEAFLGGILHGFQVPFSGLILSAFAAICMSALAIPEYRRGQILKATMLVLIVKAILSPHTPVTAYFAVGLQGVFGELIFSARTPYRIASFLLCIFALMQSAFQKLIILTIIFGIGFWKSMDDFLNSATKEMGFDTISYSIYAVGIYLGIYFIAGIVAGSFAVKLPRFLSEIPKETSELKKLNVESMYEITQPKLKKRFSNPLFWLLFILLMISIYYAYTEENVFAIIHHKALKLFIRASLVLLAWYFFIAPLLIKLFQNWLKSKEGRFTLEVKQILELIPEIKSIVRKSLQITSGYNYFSRVNRFMVLTFYQLLKKQE